jgi:hypothetical protein
MTEINNDEWELVPLVGSILDPIEAEVETPLPPIVQLFPRND